jgi:hypothetical protein
MTKPYDCIRWNHPYEYANDPLILTDGHPCSRRIEPFSLTSNAGFRNSHAMSRTGLVDGSNPRGFAPKVKAFAEKSYKKTSEISLTVLSGGLF